MDQRCTADVAPDCDAPMEAQAATDVAQFKTAMRKLTSAVTIITTRHKGRIAGLTATSVTALSVEPPSLVACVNKAAGAHDLLLEEGRFCVNIMDAGAADVATIFADHARAAERFKAATWTPGVTGVPVIEESVAHFECTLERALDGFSHTILIGVVVAARSSEGVPLLYEAGRYGAFSLI